MRNRFLAIPLIVALSLCPRLVDAKTPPTVTATPNPDVALHAACVHGMRDLVAANSENQDRYRSYTSAASDTDNAGQGAQVATRYAFPLAYAGAELEIIHELGHDDQSLFQPALDELDATGMTNVINPAHQLLNDIIQRDKNAAAWSENRFQYYRYLAGGYENLNIDITPRTTMSQYAQHINYDDAVMFNNPHICDIGPPPAQASAPPR